MSDFLGRIAARAVGARARAEPRLAGPIAGAGEGLEVVDEEIVVPGAASAAIPEGPGEAAQARAEPARPEAGPAVAPAAASPAPARPAAAPQGPAAELPRQERLPPALEPVSAGPAESEPDAPSAEPRATATPVAVAASPVGPVPVAAAPASPAAVQTGPPDRDEPPAVFVHIGRLEVRASLTEPPRPQPLPAPSEPEGLSLSDYLRGKRGA